MNPNSRSNTSHTAASVPLSNYQFDFGLTSASHSSARSLNDQKNKSAFSSSSFSSVSPSPNISSQSKPVSTSWAPNKPAWTHQPSPNIAPKSTLSNANSMVGDIFGKSWSAAAPPSTQNVRLGVSDSNPNLFSDLLGPVIGQSKNSNVPLKNASAQQPQKNSYLMGNLADSLPKTGAPMKSHAAGSAGNLGNFSSAAGSNKIDVGNFGGPSVKSGSAHMNANKDPFDSLVDFGAKPSPPVNKVNTWSESAFGTFQTAPKTGGSGSNPSPPASSSFNTSSSNAFNNFGEFASETQPSQPSQHPHSKSVNPLDMLFSSLSSAKVQTGNQDFAAADDWGVLDSEFVDHDAGGTTELEGLPPPPAGVTALTAKSKGVDNYKQGQFADAIKWLSWSVVLLEKSGDTANVEVLSCRASCYKEVGEYKKAIADCTKVLEIDGQNVAVLLQRALLYESSEKYKLGAEDLRAVLKIDPSNRLAKGTIHRLTKMAES